MNHELPDVKLDLKMAEEPEIKLPTPIGSSKKQESSKNNIYFCLIDYTKDFDCVDHSKLWKILQKIGRPDNVTCLLRNLYAGQVSSVQSLSRVRKQQLKLDMEQQTGSKLGKEYIKAVYYHPAYLTSM